MQTYIILSSLLALFTSASPIISRAGGPIAEPIPANCTVLNPLPHASCGTANVTGYAPSSNFSSSHLLYSSYFESSLSQSDQATQCLEQCYGYGDLGQCKSALVGYDIPTPKGYYGTAGGVLLTACFLYDTYMDPTIFIAARSGQYVNETAGSIYC